MRSSLAESHPCASQHYDLLVGGLGKGGGVVRTAINKEPVCNGVTELQNHSQLMTAKAQVRLAFSGGKGSRTRGQN